MMPHGLEPILAVVAAGAGAQHMTIQMVMINDDFFIICVGYTNWRRLLSMIRREYLCACDVDHCRLRRRADTAKHILAMSMG